MCFMIYQSLVFCAIFFYFTSNSFVFWKLGAALWIYDRSEMKDNDAIIWSFQITFIMARSDELILEYIV